MDFRVLGMAVIATIFHLYRRGINLEGTRLSLLHALNMSSIISLYLHYYSDSKSLLSSLYAEIHCIARLVQSAVIPLSTLIHCTVVSNHISIMHHTCEYMDYAKPGWLDVIVVY